MNNETRWHYLQKMANNPAGWIILCNLLDGLYGGLYTTYFAKTVIWRWMVQVYGPLKRKAAGGVPVQTDIRPSPSSDTEGLLWDSFDRCCFELGALYQLHARHPMAADPPVTDYATAMQAGDFWDEMVTDTEKKECEGDITRLLSEKSDTGMVQNKPVTVKRRVRLKVTRDGEEATIGKPSKVLWVTPAEGLFDSADRIHAAETLRNLLGLVHFYDCPLVVMILPRDVMAKQVYGRPTVVDAGKHRRHMTCSSRPRNKIGSSWGQTVNLTRFAKQEADMDGLPERVVRPIPVADLPEVDVWNLAGICGGKMGLTAQDNDKAFAERLCQKHGGESAMMERVREFLV